MIVIYYSLVSVLIVSLVSVVFVLPLYFKQKVSDNTLLFLLSLSVGVLLSTVFLEFLPEVFEHDYGLSSFLIILFGFLIMFLLEKFIHSNHKNKKIKNQAHHLGPINLFGDGIHNFIDGLIIASTYSVSIVTGLAATLSIIFHEIPQEISDFGILLYSGIPRRKALVLNFLSALVAVIGTILGLVLLTHLHEFSEKIILFAVGNFIYIAASNLVPQLHRHCDIKNTIMHLLAILLGVSLVAILIIFGPAHLHV